MPLRTFALILPKLTVLSYNVNGIRAAINKGFMHWIQTVSPDVICLQEIKALEEQLDLQAFAKAGYPHTYWYSATKKGYSGVAILSKTEPEEVLYGTGIEYMDFEGRNITAKFNGISVMSLYMPSGTNENRLGIKFRYMEDFKNLVTAMGEEHPNLVLCGDFNICHRPIDIHDPIRNKKVSGFLPEERAWLGELLECGFTDSFRHLNPNPHHYTWWSYRANARNNNKGWRIDYALISNALTPRLKRAVILKEARHSDHCPVMIELT